MDNLFDCDHTFEECMCVEGAVYVQALRIAPNVKVEGLVVNRPQLAIYDYTREVAHVSANGDLVWIDDERSGHVVATGCRVSFDSFGNDGAVDWPAMDWPGTWTLITLLVLVFGIMTGSSYERIKAWQARNEKQ